MATTAAADRLADQACHVGEVNCLPTGSGGLRFDCGVPEIGGEAKIVLRRSTGRYAIRGCPPPGKARRHPGRPICVFAGRKAAHRTVAEENPAERRAAALPAGFDGISHVTCAQNDPHDFDCDALMDEEGIKDGIAFELSPEDHFFLVEDCSVTRFWNRLGAALACRRIAWGVNFMESEARELARGEL